WTEDLPAFEPISLATSTGLGYGGAWGLSIIIFGLVTWFTIRIEKKKNTTKMAALPKTSGWKRIFRGAWPLFAAAIALAVLNAVILMTRRLQWCITSAFALLCYNIAMFFGIDVVIWGYWQGANEVVLNSSIFADSTTVLNLCIILGALLASAVIGLF